MDVGRGVRKPARRAPPRHARGRSRRAAGARRRRRLGEPDRGGAGDAPRVSRVRRVDSHRSWAECCGASGLDGTRMIRHNEGATLRRHRPGYPAQGLWLLAAGVVALLLGVVIARWDTTAGQVVALLLGALALVLTGLLLRAERRLARQAA